MNPINDSLNTIQNRLWTRCTVVIGFAVLIQIAFNLSNHLLTVPTSSQVLVPAQKSEVKNGGRSEFNPVSNNSTGHAGLQDFSRQQRGQRSASDRASYPTWEIDSQFKDDVFTFVRIQYDSTGRARRGGQWSNDYPDCDWIESYGYSGPS